MRNAATPLYILLLVVGDFFALLAGFIVAYVLRVTVDTRPLITEVPSHEYLQIFLILLPFIIITFAALNLYKREVYDHIVPEASRLAVVSFITILLILGYEFVSEQTVFPARLVAFYGLIGSFTLLLIERSILRWLRKHMYKFGIGVQKVMLIGSTPATKTLAKLLHTTESSGYDIKAIVGRKESIPKGFTGRHFSNLDKALTSANRLGVNIIVQTQFFDDPRMNRRILRLAQQKHMAYRFIPTQEEFFTGNHTVELFHGFPVIAVHQTRLFGWERILKRGFDVGVSILALPFVIFVYLVFGLVIKLTDWRGPVLYKDKRVTRFGGEFYAYKFRSMYWKYCRLPGQTDEQILKSMGRVDLAEKVASGDMQIVNDPRLMPIGRFMRATSLDEIPQFINVLKGHMSLVGPRAITLKDMRLYKDQGSQLLYVKTGLTGLAQISGRSDISYEERAKLNLYYVQNWSFMLDFRILLRTIAVILKGQGNK